MRLVLAKVPLTVTGEFGAPGMPWANGPGALVNVTSRPVLFQLPFSKLPVTLTVIGVAHAVALPGVFSKWTVTSILWIVTLVVVVLVIVHGNDAWFATGVAVQLTANCVPMQFWNPALVTIASEELLISTSNCATAHVEPAPAAVVNERRPVVGSGLGESRTAVTGKPPAGSTNQLAADATPGNANAHNDRTPAKSKTLFFDNIFISKLLVSPGNNAGINGSVPPAPAFT
ncbi:hypothetical protein [Baekduia sp.]|uniref:hypothetical protein n=1 Tax=Baekduia sp. TaxID=2600305 RepID=UPI002DF7D4D9|nr:hypothetical protein [Baekduia sp.]